MDFFHIQQIKTYPQTVVCDGNRMVMSDKAFQEEGQAEFVWYIVFCLVAMAMMAASNFLSIKARKTGAEDVAAATIAFAAAFAAIYNNDDGEWGGYYSESIFFYFFALGALFV